ncbi:MAG: sodium:proton antiporter [Xanthomonadales bacterium]|nr:sodium:proton antiporter [Xanthomonadales bacterium]
MKDSSLIAFYAAALVGIGAFCNWLAWRLNLPAILFLLLVGLLLGPGLGVLDPDAALGDLLFPLVSLGVAIILFEGALTLRFSDIRNVRRIIRNLTTLGVLVTWGVMGAAAHYLVGLEWPLALLFGALVTVTGPTVVAPLLRSIRPSSRVASILHWEGILIDPIGAALVVLVFEFIMSGGGEAASLLEFGKVVLIGSVIGLVAGFALAQILKRHWLPDFLENYTSLAVVLVVFTFANLLGKESGLIAVTVLGIVLANTRDLDVRELISFKEDLTLVLLTVLFILLAARLQVDDLRQVLWPALGLLAVALFIARPLSVWVSSLGTSVTVKEKMLLSWVAPRGIVAAAVSSLFALRLTAEGNEQAELLVPLTFVIIIGTVVVQSLTAGSLAKALGLSSRDQDGVLITSANRVALALGEALDKAGVKVMVVDTDRSGLHLARMRGLSTFYGNPISEYTERYLEMTPYNQLLAVSRSHDSNMVICYQFRHQFDKRTIYTIRTGGVDAATDEEEVVPELRFNPLFQDGTTWSKMASLLSRGAEIRSTPLTEQYGLEEYRERMGAGALPLFAIDEEGTLQWVSGNDVPEPGPGWTLASLIPPEQIEALNKERHVPGNAEPASG